MRTIFILFLINIFFLSELNGQEKNKGLEIRFSLIHPYRRFNNYKLSLDPSIEALYYRALSDKYLISGGIMAQKGNNNWEELTSHQFYDGFMWRPGRGYYTRELKYFSMGIPLKLEKKINNFLFNSMFIGITGGRYFYFNLTDSMDERVIPIEVEYDQFFWDFQFGFKKFIYHSSGLSIGISSVAGVRIQHTNIYNLNEYAWYGMSFNVRSGK